MKPNTPGKKRITDRTRMLLTLELAIILPCGFAHGVQRVEPSQDSARQSHRSGNPARLHTVLRIAEKKTWMRANGDACAGTREFPCGTEESEIKPEMESTLEAHPEFLYAIFYNKEHNILMWRSRRRAATATMTSAGEWPMKLR